jgi:hypothetical protein
MKDKGNYVKIDELLDFGEQEDLVADLLAQYDKLIASDIVAVFKKYFPYSTVDEEKVLKLARMLVADEKGGVQE